MFLKAGHLTASRPRSLVYPCAFVVFPVSCNVFGVRAGHHNFYVTTFMHKEHFLQTMSVQTVRFHARCICILKDVYSPHILHLETVSILHESLVSAFSTVNFTVCLMQSFEWLDRVSEMRNANILSLLDYSLWTIA